MKYKDWKPKMTCGSSCEDGNEVEMFLPCGHVLCQKCVKSIQKDRSRACPFCRNKFSLNDPTLIHWDGKKE